jgi:membrane associated rhomboid family serine protease
MNLFEKNKNNNYLNNIIYINVIAFIAINFYYVLIFLFKTETKLISHLGLSANLDILATKPWSIFTYMFVHEDLLHLIINLCWLYFGGKIFISYLNSRDLLSTYVMGGLAGAAIYILSFNIFPVFEILKMNSLAIGSSASVLAVLFAAATYTPNFPINIFFSRSIKLKHIAMLAIMIDILSIPQGNSGGHIAHIGGALYGFLYIYLKKYNINSNYLIDNMLFFLKRRNTTFTYSKKETDYEYNDRKQHEQKKIDSILDKISMSGYDSLSKEEKDDLFNQK